MNHFLHNMQMYLVGASYWNQWFMAWTSREVEKRRRRPVKYAGIGGNMAFLLKKLNKLKLSRKEINN